MQLSAMECSDTGRSKRRWHVALFNGKLISVAASSGKEDT